MFDPEVNQRLKKLTNDLCEAIPGFQEVLEGTTEDGVMSTMAFLNTFLMDNPEYAPRIEELTAAAFADPIPEEGSAQLPVKVNTEHYPLAIDEEHVVVQPPGTRIPMLNPLLQGAIAERIQYDGDAPELRTGSLPEGATPAVPVVTNARNPVALGWMLETASEEVQEEIRELEDQHEQRLLENKEEIDLAQKMLPAGWDETSLAVPDPKGYEKGKLPELRLVTPPQGEELALLSSEQKNILSFKALSTTQGRRSAVVTIRNLVSTALEEGGFDIAVNEDRPLPIEDVPVFSEWTTSIHGGSHQSAFSFIDTAARVLATRLADQLERVEIDNPVLEVMPVDTVDVRKVGWAARVVSRYY